MKRTIVAALITAVIIFVMATGVKAQKKDSLPPKYDTVAILTLQEAQQLIYYMQLQSQNAVNVKPETWNELIGIIQRKLQLVKK